MERRNERQKVKTECRMTKGEITTCWLMGDRDHTTVARSSASAAVGSQPQNLKHLGRLKVSQ